MRYLTATRAARALALTIAVAAVARGVASGQPVPNAAQPPVPQQPAPSAPATRPVLDVVMTPDIEYASVDDESLRLNLAMPKDASGKLPLIVVIHGGAWRAGDRSNHNDLVRQLAQKGYVAATIGYRFCPKHPFPAQIQDAKCAVRFLRANAEKFHIDPDRVGATGFSAGAHLSMLLGAMDPSDGLDDSGGSEGFSSKVQAVVAFFGPTDFELPAPPQTHQLLEDFFGKENLGKPEALRRASPVAYVNAGDPPMLLLQGTSDPLVPHAHAIRMAEAMQKAGVPGRVELIVGGGHGNWSATEYTRAAAAMTAFFDEHLKKADGGEKKAGGPGR